MKINLKNKLGVSSLNTEITPPEWSRVKVYIVPEELSEDRHFIAIQPPGAVEIIPPSLIRETTLIAEYESEELIYLHPDVTEVKDA